MQAPLHKPFQPECKFHPPPAPNTTLFPQPLAALLHLKPIISCGISVQESRLHCHMAFFSLHEYHVCSSILYDQLVIGTLTPACTPMPGFSAQGFIDPGFRPARQTCCMPMWHLTERSSLDISDSLLMLTRILKDLSALTSSHNEMPAFTTFEPWSVIRCVGIINTD